MSISKLKTLVITVLLLMNLFLLADIFIQRVETARELAGTVTSLKVILQNSGIELRDNSINETGALTAYITAQDAYGESTIARAVLGDCEPGHALAGENQRYTGELGTAVFYARGDFVIELTGERGIDGNVKRAVKKLLRSMSISTGEPVVTVLGNTEIVTAHCAWRDSTIFNCTVTFEISNGRLLRVMGRRAAVVSDFSPAVSYDLASLLLAFLRYDLANEIGCTEITSVQPGYRLNVSGFGEGELSPGWLFVTDCGDYFADAVNGEILRNDV